MVTERTISFSELRQTTNRIIDLISEVTHYDKNEISLKTSINNTIGVDGDDWDEVISALHKKENLVLEGFNFYDYFQDEGQIAWGPLNIIFLPIYFIMYVTTFKWRQESFRNYFSFNDGPKPDLTIADLVTSKLEGKFVKRIDRKFRITSPPF
jgi:hypothetical protein